MKARLPLLLAVCAGLGWIAVEGGATSTALPDAARRATAETLAAAPVALPPLPAGPWPEQVRRPLFAPDRRPPAASPPPAVAEAPPETPPPVAASGVVLRPSGAMALLRLADERTVRAVEGDEVEGWRVARIGAEGVQLSRGDRVLHLPVRARAAEGMLRH